MHESLSLASATSGTVPTTTTPPGLVVLWRCWGSGYRCWEFWGLEFGGLGGFRYLENPKGLKVQPLKDNISSDKSSPRP